MSLLHLVLLLKVGTYGDVVVADAIIKQVPGFEVSTAWEAIRKDSYAEDPSGHDGVGKAGLRHYDEHQYIPSDVGVSEMVRTVVKRKEVITLRNSEFMS